MSKPVVWTIAGSDSGGGAGIQADLHTFADFAVHGCSVITAVTAQNSVTTRGIYGLSSTEIKAQLTCLLDDMPPQAIKIGLISNSAQLQAIADFLNRWPEWIERPFVVWDPVIISTQRDCLSSLTPDECRALMTEVDVMTPNTDELEWLSGTAVFDQPSLVRASGMLLESGCKAVLATGVHVNDDGGRVCDHLYCSNRQQRFCHEHLSTTHDHGTGCTLSAAIAAAVAHGYPLEDALVLAHAYVHKGLRCAEGVGSGPGPVAHTGWPTELENFPQVCCKTLPVSDVRFAPLKYSPALYPVVDSVEWLQQLLDLGLRTLQLRIKRTPDKSLEQQIKTAVALGRHYDAQIFINDHWALALKYGAFGVHLGQQDLADADLNAIAQAGLRLGISTHGYTEMLIALRCRPSYIALGHIFPTRTKVMPSQPQGTKRLRDYVALLSATDIPTVAIGGINLANLDEVMATGVDGVAVVTAITQAESVEDAVRRLMARLEVGCAE